MFSQCFCFLQPQDGAFNVMCLHNMLLQQRSSEETFLCLGNRHWAAMAWPVVAFGARGNHYKLNISQGATFVFAFEPSDWVAAPVSVFMLDGVGVILRPQIAFEPLPQAALRQSSSAVTFGDLSIIAKAVGLEEVRHMSRANLISLICDQLGDPAFKDFIQSQEGTHVNKEKVPKNPELTSLLLEGLDKDEVSEFKELQKHVSPKSQVKRKWGLIVEANKASKAVAWLQLAMLLVCLLFMSVCVC